MRVVFAGTPEVALPSLRAIAASPHQIVGVVTRPDAPAGRGRALRPSPVGEFGAELGVPVLTPRSAKDPGFAEELAALQPDVCPVVAYGSLVPRRVIDIPRLGWVNLHFSLLPAWRGAAPVQHAILHGDEVTGATAFLLEEGMDTGPVLGTMTETIRPADTSGDLLGRLAEAGAGLLVAALDGLESGSIAPVPQPADGVSMAPKITAADGEIRWSDPAFAIDRRVRACTPAPGAWTTFRGTRLKIGGLTPSAPDDIQPAAGELRATKKAVYVGTGSTPVRLDVVQPHGKKAMPGADWARGVRVDEGETFG
ncbi:methionyl-tRNA formyltransferase [Flexivirga oryzae]|uniref:Methionyl-tRNA formyltransferase n=1 Tax=Flexivirga oryzae TaxID=1794944 RepID=A0A839N5J8_9MICO|nr:methionyl-tRNA formyltransferase [Flexivirga oryzae]MBB2891313.1 methionyl-tRNA formyltransferase [Flexivirga oryzae]